MGAGQVRPGESGERAVHVPGERLAQDYAVLGDGRALDAVGDAHHEVRGGLGWHGGEFPSAGPEHSRFGGPDYHELVGVEPRVVIVAVGQQLGDQQPGDGAQRGRRRNRGGITLPVIVQRLAGVW